MQNAESKPPTSTALSNSEIADELLALAQLLTARRENPFKVKAYRRAAKTIKSLGESVDELLRNGGDLLGYSGIGAAIDATVREIVMTGTLRKIQTLRSQVPPEVSAITEYPQLDPRRVLRIYKKLGISSVDALKDRLESGEIAARLGARMDQHVRQALNESQEMRWSDAKTLVAAIQEFLTVRCGVSRAEAVGDYRRRVEVLAQISFLVETENLPMVLEKMKGYGGKPELLIAAEDYGVIKLSTGTVVRITAASREKWGLALLISTGSPQHLRQLETHGPNLETLVRSVDSYRTEESIYREIGLSFIPPELREGHDEIALSAQGRMATLVSCTDIRGELHAHSTSSDGVNTIEEMANAAREKGYEYIGISDHSQTLKIAAGLAAEDLWAQIRFIDKLNERLDIRVLKSSEVDILQDGSLDYPDELLKELDYTVCSIHSRFGLGKTEQTERILRAMDNRYFNILGHATGRLLLKRPGYEIDIGRIIEHAARNGCQFEINSSPDRLDLSAENARLARQAGIQIAITTDAHSTRDFEYLQYGVDQARRAGLDKASILNHSGWPVLQRIFRR